MLFSMCNIETLGMICYLDKQTQTQHNKTPGCFGPWAFLWAETILTNLSETKRTKSLKKRNFWSESGTFLRIQ